ncbi:MAG: hypothetical protein KAT49_03935 [Methanomicrobia archaeon]|nr:hypothetical protein [Methanomicrobia archaeon]
MPHTFEFSYPPDPFFGTVPLKFYQTPKELEEKLEKFYKGSHSFYNRQRLIDKPLEKFKDIKSGTHIELSEKHFKKGIVDTAVLDLKKIKDIPKEETPQELETRLVRVYNYLDFLIKTYENYGNETTSPPSSDFEDKMSSFEDMKKCLKEAENS